MSEKLTRLKLSNSGVVYWSKADPATEESDHEKYAVALWLKHLPKKVPIKYLYKISDTLWEEYSSALSEAEALDIFNRLIRLTVDEEGNLIDMQTKEILVKLENDFTYVDVEEEPFNRYSSKYSDEEEKIGGNN